MFSFYKNIVLKFSGIIFYTVQGGDGSYERRTQFCKNRTKHQDHMSNLEHGRVSVNLKVLLRLSHYFSCGVDALLGLTLNTEVKPQEVEDKYTAEELLDILKVLKKQVI